MGHRAQVQGKREEGERERNPPGEGRNRYSNGSVVDQETRGREKTADIKQSAKHLVGDKK